MTTDRLREIAKELQWKGVSGMADELRAHADELDSLQGADSPQSVCNDLPLLFNRCHAVGLHATGQLMHEAVRKSGFELADMLEKAKKAKAAR